RPRRFTFSASGCGENFSRLLGFGSLEAPLDALPFDAISAKRARLEARYRVQEKEFLHNATRRNANGLNDLILVVSALSSRFFVWRCGEILWMSWGRTEDKHQHPPRLHRSAIECHRPEDPLSRRLFGGLAQQRVTAHSFGLGDLPCRRDADPHADGARDV